MMTIGEMLKLCSVTFRDFTFSGDHRQNLHFDCQSSHFSRFFPISPSRAQPDNNHEGEGNQYGHGGGTGNGHDDGNQDGAGTGHNDSGGDDGCDGDGDDDGDSSDDDVDATL